MMYRERSQKSEQQGLRINLSVLIYNQKSIVPEGRLLSCDRLQVASPPGHQL